MADVKVSALTAATTASDDDLLYVVDDPAGTPASKKITVANFITSIQGTGAGDVAAGNHTHTGVYEPANANLLETTDIGVSVQAYDADLAAIAGLTATSDNFIQAKSSAWASRTPAQVTADLIAMVGDSGAGGTKGLVPAPGAGDAAAGKFLKADGVWTAPSGGGDVVGPSSATDNAIVRFDGTTGRLVQNSAATIADTTGDVTAGKYNTVAISGTSTPTLAVTGTTTVSGANTGDQTITLTGDVTGSGTGSFAATIANDAVTYAKMQNVSATDKVLGRSTSGAGDVEEIPCTAAGRALIDDADAAAQRTTLGLVIGTNVQAYDADLPLNTLTFVIDGGGSAITTGVKGDIEVPFNCTIQQVTMLADQSGSIVVDIWKDTYANYPPTDADSITASAVPTISAATKSQDATLTGWTTSVSAGDILRYNVDSASTVTRVTVSLKVTK